MTLLGGKHTYNIQSPAFLHPTGMAHWLAADAPPNVITFHKILSRAGMADRALPSPSTPKRRVRRLPQKGPKSITDELPSIGACLRGQICRVHGPS